MKKIISGTRKTKSFSVTVPIGLAPIIRQEARAQGRNVSGFIVWLVRKDQEKKSF